MAEAPPVKTSIRSTNSDGMVLKSTALEPGTPETTRLPLINTNVREVPKFLKSTDATPALELEKLELVRLIEGVPISGICNKRSCKLVTPEAAISCELMTVIGDGESAEAERIRDPVTSITACGVDWAIPNNGEKAPIKIKTALLN